MNYLIIAFFLVVNIVSWALAQSPPTPPPTCDEQLNRELWEKGGAIKDLAVAREQVRVLTKENAELKVKVVELKPKPEKEKK